MTQSPTPKPTPEKNPDTAPRLALVGHCTPDAFALTSAIKGALPKAQIDRLDSHEGVAQAADEYDLLLVNRVLDGDFPDTSGIALIGALSAAGARTMLISNYPESIEQSVRAGAVPGFGKTDMRSDKAAEALRGALGMEV